MSDGGADNITLPDVNVTAKPPTPTTGSYGTSAPYAVRYITLSFSVAGSQAITLSADSTTPGLRAIVHVELATLPSTGNAQIRVFGMSLNHMNALSTAGQIYKIGNNSVTVQAGDLLSGMTTVFQGKIIEAYPDAKKQPDVSFYVFAVPTGIIQRKPVTPTTFPGPTPAATVLNAIAGLAGVTLENSSVNGVLSSPYFAGSAWDQIVACTRALNCYCHFDGVNGVLAVWSKTGSRSSGGTPEISPPTFMINYPEFEKNTVRVRQIFDPTNPAPGIGQKFVVQSEFAAATGTWYAIMSTYDLASWMPDGPWEVGLRGVAIGG